VRREYFYPPLWFARTSQQNATVATYRAAMLGHGRACHQDRSAPDRPGEPTAQSRSRTWRCGSGAQLTTPLPHLAEILDLRAEDCWRNVYAGELRSARTRSAHHWTPFLGLEHRRSAICKHFATDEDECRGVWPCAGTLVRTSRTLCSRVCLAVPWPAHALSVRRVCPNGRYSRPPGCPQPPFRWRSAADQGGCPWYRGRRGWTSLRTARGRIEIR
jgi:hypothetical protein